jgi:hypothetical protein
MRTKIIILGIICIAVAYLYYRFNVIWTGEKIDVKELGTIEVSKETEKYNFFDDEDWLIITGEEQRKNWIASGYPLPRVDFKKSFIVLSNYKMKAIYQENGCDSCTGVPNGFALYDYFNSVKGTYYIYEIPAIRLSQGVG